MIGNKAKKQNFYSKMSKMLDVFSFKLFIGIFMIKINKMDMF
ncbi:hypothetical protein LLT6_08185 [Lactococcus cremoris subsp. cremoris TIFN6]|uniref:Uncharacterized protein n=1 Tax=Lactococcus cremoris subsp. cremoris TIFN6 TaxID=1234876 RepID=T0SCT8_LACLC|nr:hypothetical protein LLT6_08185 [Lactococcus cremoris subsp. cremoris TIFN6]